MKNISGWGVILAFLICTLVDLAVIYAEITRGKDPMQSYMSFILFVLLCILFAKK